MIPAVRITTQSGIMTSDVLSEEFSRRRIYITGIISDEMAADVCAQINYLASLNNDDDIWLIIQSTGGSVPAGCAILDTMTSCDCDINTLVVGEAASMAAIIASAGTKGKRYIGENAEMMIHQAMGGASGQTVDIIRSADHIKKVNQRLYRLLCQNTGKSYAQIQSDCDRDSYFNSKEAIGYGLIDKIFDGFDE